MVTYLFAIFLHKMFLHAILIVLFLVCIFNIRVILFKLKYFGIHMYVINISTNMLLAYSLNIYMCVCVYIYIYIYIFIYIFDWIGFQLWHTGSFLQCASQVVATCGVNCLVHGIWDLGFPTRDQTHGPCSGRQILNHWVTREVPPQYSFFFLCKFKNDFFFLYLIFHWYYKEMQIDFCGLIFYLATLRNLFIEFEQLLCGV